eukprot:scaffold417_cov252-Pinguiococcus_pyrenoidosus.AAC.6
METLVTMPSTHTSVARRWLRRPRGDTCASPKLPSNPTCSRLSPFFFVYDGSRSRASCSSPKKESPSDTHGLHERQEKVHGAPHELPREHEVMLTQVIQRDQDPRPSRGAHAANPILISEALRSTRGQRRAYGCVAVSGRSFLPLPRSAETRGTPSSHGPPPSCTRPFCHK